jgi:hypothetical protein
VVKPRNQWAGESIRWVEDQHVLDEMDDLVPLEKNSDEEDNKRPKNARNERRKVGKSDRKIVVRVFNRPWFKLHVKVALFAALNLNVVVRRAMKPCHKVGCLSGSTGNI